MFTFNMRLHAYQKKTAFLDRGMIAAMAAE
jgi:hypothetical protein